MNFAQDLKSQLYCINVLVVSFQSRSVILGCVSGGKMVANLCSRCTIKIQKVKQRLSAVAYFTPRGEVIWVQTNRTEACPLALGFPGKGGRVVFEKRHTGGSDIWIWLLFINVTFRLHLRIHFTPYARGKASGPALKVEQAKWECPH